MDYRLEKILSVKKIRQGLLSRFASDAEDMLAKMVREYEARTGRKYTDDSRVEDLDEAEAKAESVASGETEETPSTEEMQDEVPDLLGDVLDVNAPTEAPAESGSTGPVSTQAEIDKEVRIQNEVISLLIEYVNALGKFISSKQDERGRVGESYRILGSWMESISKQDEYIEEVLPSFSKLFNFTINKANDFLEKAGITKRLSAIYTERVGEYSKLVKRKISPGLSSTDVKKSDSLAYKQRGIELLQRGKHNSSEVEEIKAAIEAIDKYIDFAKENRVYRAYAQEGGIDSGSSDFVRNIKETESYWMTELAKINKEKEALEAKPAKTAKDYKRLRELEEREVKIEPIFKEKKEQSILRDLINKRSFREKPVDNSVMTGVSDEIRDVATVRLPEHLKGTNEAAQVAIDSLEKANKVIENWSEYMVELNQFVSSDSESESESVPVKAGLSDGIKVYSAEPDKPGLFYKELLPDFVPEEEARRTLETLMSLNKSDPATVEKKKSFQADWEKRKQVSGDTWESLNAAMARYMGQEPPPKHIDSIVPDEEKEDFGRRWREIPPSEQSKISAEHRRKPGTWEELKEATEYTGGTYDSTVLDETVGLPATIVKEQIEHLQAGVADALAEKDIPRRKMQRDYESSLISQVKEVVRNDIFHIEEVGEQSEALREQLHSIKFRLEKAISDAVRILRNKQAHHNNASLAAVDDIKSFLKGKVFSEKLLKEKTQLTEFEKSIQASFLHGAWKNPVAASGLDLIVKDFAREKAEKSREKLTIQKKPYAEVPIDMKNKFDEQLADPEGPYAQTYYRKKNTPELPFEKIEEGLTEDTRIKFQKQIEEKEAREAAERAEAERAEAERLEREKDESGQGKIEKAFLEIKKVYAAQEAAEQEAIAAPEAAGIEKYLDRLMKIEDLLAEYNSESEEEVSSNPFDSLGSMMDSAWNKLKSYFSPEPAYAGLDEEKTIKQESSLMGTENYGHLDQSQNKLVKSEDGSELIIDKDLKNLVSKRVKDLVKGAFGESESVNVDFGDYIGSGTVQAYLGDGVYRVAVSLPYAGVIEVEEKNLLKADENLWR